MTSPDATPTVEGLMALVERFSNADDAAAWEPCGPAVRDRDMARAAVEAYARRLCAPAAPTQQPVAPWPDFIGQAIHQGAQIVHPDGSEGTVLYWRGEGIDSDKWRVAYEDGTVSRLCLQIGEKGRAVLAAPTQPEPAAKYDGDPQQDAVLERAKAAGFRYDGQSLWTASLYTDELLALLSSPPELYRLAEGAGHIVSLSTTVVDGKRVERLTITTRIGPDDKGGVA